MFKNFEKHIRHSFKNKSLLLEAFTHSSYVNESSEAQKHNERLEFLGDAVLELCISHKLFASFPETREGELTKMRSKLVSQPSLAALARKFSFEQYLKLGKGEENQGGRSRDALLSDAFEAVLGAVFEDGGFEAASGVVDVMFEGSWPAYEQSGGGKDYKSLLQEFTQKNFQSRPVYVLCASKGPEHAKIFEVSLTLPDGRIFTAEAGSVKRAEQKAASLALEALAENEPESAPKG